MTQRFWNLPTRPDFQSAQKSGLSPRTSAGTDDDDNDHYDDDGDDGDDDDDDNGHDDEDVMMTRTCAGTAPRGGNSFSPPATRPSFLATRVETFDLFFSFLFCHQI